MDDAGIREALRRLDEAYRRGLERLNRTQALINLSQHALRGRRSTRRSAWRTATPDDGDTDAPDAEYRHEESRHHMDSTGPDRSRQNRG